MNNKGFTLIELLVVIGIISLLSAIVVPNFMGARERARDTQRKSDVRQLQKALEMYKDDQPNLSYIPDFSGLTCGIAWNNATGTVTYMSKFPCDPSNSTPKYIYARERITGDILTYTLYACLENKSDPSGVIATAEECSSLIKYQINEP